MESKTRQVQVGGVKVGGGAPVSVQTMTKTDTRDVRATVEQIQEAASLGCDIVRLAVVDEAAAIALGEIRRQITTPIVADIHFDCRLAVMAARNGADGLRINPGNIGGRDKVAAVVGAARERSLPIRIGVNSGSLEQDIVKECGGRTAEALVKSALRHVNLIEDFDYDQIKISVKATDVKRTVEAYRILSEQTDYPLHLGVTEAGTMIPGTVRSSVAMGILLSEGIGDTIRVSLTDTPSAEVKVGLEILRALGLREPGPSVVSCPTCGRVEVDVALVARRVEQELEQFYRSDPSAFRPNVAVMGCMVNGPGEARDADIALVGGRHKFGVFVKGRQLATVPEDQAIVALMEQVKKWAD